MLFVQKYDYEDDEDATADGSSNVGDSAQFFENDELAHINCSVPKYLNCSLFIVALKLFLTYFFFLRLLILARQRKANSGRIGNPL